MKRTHKPDQTSMKFAAIALFYIFLSSCSWNNPYLPNTYTPDPIISDIIVTTTDASVTVAWTTDIAADSKIEYGLTTEYGWSAADITMVTSHSLTLTENIQGGIEYHCRITSATFARGSGVSTDFTATTTLIALPIISGITVTGADTSITVSWTTDMPADSKIDYGLTTAYGFNATAAAMTTTHSLTISADIISGGVYHGRITSTNGTGGSSSSSDFSVMAWTPVAGDHWFRNWAENATPVVDDSATQDQYYSMVLYDAAAFGNTQGQDIDGAGGGTDTYTVVPYYKMWVGDGSNTDFLYSNDGETWVRPTIGANIVGAGYYHPVILYNVGGYSGYRMWNWNSAGSLAAYNEFHYFTSSDGIVWTAIPGGNMLPDSPTFSNLVNTSSPIYDACIFYEGSTFYAWINNNGLWYHYTSTDPSNATLWTFVGSALLDGTTFNTDGRMWIIHRGGTYELWYSSDVNGVFAGNRRAGISYAESTDGLAFVSVNNLPVRARTNAILDIGDGMTYRDSYTYTPTVIYDANQFSGHGYPRHYRMYLSARSTTYNPTKRTICYVDFNEPAP